ncbi:NADPH-dependent FMN reductase [Lutibacter sp.]
MKNIVTIGGSTSKSSINKILAEYTGNLVKNVVVTNVDLNDFKMPLFSVDIQEKQGFSKGTTDLNGIIAKADGFIISLAEHNGAYSAAFKNVFDWLSIVESKVWRNKPMLLLSTSPGVRGGESVLKIALNRFPYMGGNIIGSMIFPSFFDNFKENTIVNTALKLKLTKLVSKFEKAL